MKRFAKIALTAKMLRPDDTRRRRTMLKRLLRRKLTRKKRRRKILTMETAKRDCLRGRSGRTRLRRSWQSSWIPRTTQDTPLSWSSCPAVSGRDTASGESQRGKSSPIRCSCRPLAAWRNSLGRYEISRELVTVNEDAVQLQLVSSCSFFCTPSHSLT